MVLCGSVRGVKGCYAVLWGAVGYYSLLQDAVGVTGRCGMLWGGTGATVLHSAVQHSVVLHGAEHQPCWAPSHPGWRS